MEILSVAAKVLGSITPTVKLCHSLLQDEFGGQKNAEWKSYCSAVINSKESLEFIFLLSGLEKEVFSILEKVFKTFEEFKIKDQTSSVSQAKKLMCGAMQQPNLVASKFKCIRGLDTDSLKALLAKVADGEMSFAEMKLRAMEIKNIAALKTEFVKKAGCESWEEALERFPDFTSEELLQQFIGSVHKRKADREFMALIERALQAEVSVQDNGQSGHSTLCKINGTWYCALRSEGHKVTSELLRNIPFTGADLTVIQDQPTWCEEKVKSVIRQICGLNTRSKLSNYIIVIRKKSDPSLFEGCTPAGKGHIMYVAWSGMSAKAGTGLTNTVEKVAVLFVGTTSRSATNWFVAKKEQDLMRHLIEVFIPPRGMLLELGSSQAQVSSSLIPAFDCKVNLLSIYDKQDPVSAFNMEITKLSNARSSASGTDAE